MMGKVTKGFAVVMFIALVVSYSNFASPTQTATLTPIMINTLFFEHSPTPSATHLPTSTHDPRPTNTFAPTPTYSGTLTFTPTLLPTIQNPPTRSSKVEFPSNLVLDEWNLMENSGLTRISFKPVLGTREQVLDKYKNFGSFDIFPSPLIQGHYNKVMLHGQELVAKEEIIAAQSIIHVLYNGNEISQVNAGYPYAAPNIWGLWTYEDHWIMEYVNVFDHPYGGRYTLGNIIWDGESLNHKFGYQESFGLTALNGRILYFFRKNDRIGISYGGTEYNLDYEFVPRYGCCEIGLYMNPRGLGTGWQLNQNLSFFAERNGSKYFVVIWAR